MYSSLVLRPLSPELNGKNSSEKLMQQLSGFRIAV